MKLDIVKIAEIKPRSLFALYVDGQLATASTSAVGMAWLKYVAAASDLIELTYHTISKAAFVDKAADLPPWLADLLLVADKGQARPVNEEREL